MSTGIDRREFLKVLGAGAASLTLPSFVLNAAAKTKSKPNIILIMTDDVGYESFGCYGSTQYKTPEIDKLAKTGVRFTHCYSQPLCTPSRVQIMTGRYNHRNYKRFGKLETKEITFGNIMKKAGYATCIAGKWQLGGGHDSPGHFGFDDYCLWHLKGRQQRYWQPRITANGKELADAKDKYGPDVITGHITDFITKNKSKPFFVYYPMCLPHYPFCATPDSKGEKSEKKQGVQFFDDMVAYIDKLAGRIVKKLDDLKLREKTLIMFTSDNGADGRIRSRLGNRTIKGGKGSTTEAGMHVPFVVNWKGTVPGGKVCDDLVDFSDFLPTIAEAGGAQVPKDRIIDGRSFSPQLKGGKGKPREWIYCYYKGKGKGKIKIFSMDKQWKLYADGRMYDVKNDPREKSPVQGDGANRQIKARLQKVIDSMK